MLVDASIIFFSNLDEIVFFKNVLKSLLISDFGFDEKQKYVIAMFLNCLSLIYNYKLQEFIPDVNISVPFEKRRFIK